MELPPLGPKPAAIAAQSATRSARDVASDPDAPARAAAKAFEATFLAEMLKDTGLNAMPTELGGGGAGEEAFSGFLTTEYARLMSERGGIGLAEQIFETLKQKAPGP